MKRNAAVPPARRAGVALGIALGLAAPHLAPSAALAREPRQQAADRDGDGVPDDLDRCPDRAGIMANLGCPDRDQDNDGIVDRLDACPSVAGSKDNQGCPGEATPAPPLPASPGQPGAAAQPGPPPAEELAQLRGKRLVWPEPVAFDLAQDTLTPRGVAAVESAARVLSAHPEIHHVMIEGHVDEPGNSAARARDLSKRRADTVKRALVEKGVAAERLRTAGFGYSRLLDRSETPAAARINNRIEIVVID